MLKTISPIKSLFAMFLAAPLLGCGSPVYTIESIDAVVVDDATQRPLEGVVVLAHWQLVRGGLDGPMPVGQLAIREAVTDSQGRFHIDGFTATNPRLGELRNHDPRLILFKAGYDYRTLVNSYGQAGTDTPGFHRRSQANGTMVKLHRIEQSTSGPAQRWYAYIGPEVMDVLGDCGWKKVPRMLRAMDVEFRRLRLEIPGSQVELLNTDDLDLKDGQRCGLASTFLKENK